MMDEKERGYLIGVLDTIVTLKVRFRQDSRYNTGYALLPQVSVSRPERYAAAFDICEKYCNERDISYRITPLESRHSIQFRATGQENVETFLSPIAEEFTQRRDSVEIMRQDILPAFKAGQHLSKQGHYDLMDAVEALRSTRPKSANTKYTKQYFADRWAGEIET